MKPSLRTVRWLAGAALVAPLLVSAQNIAIVNGKPVPKARVDTLIQQAMRSGQQLPPEAEKQARDQVVLREIYAQEAERQGVAATPEYRQSMELARQSILIRELFDQYRKKNPVSEAEITAEYNTLKAQMGGMEYRARHILVEKEDEAKAIIAQLKGGASFEELAKKSKDPGSAERGGDLDFAKPDAYVPEFGAALKALKKGELTATPVKTQFGYHVIRLDDTREAPVPPLADVKPQIQQRLEQLKLQAFQEKLRTGARTDYKFEAPQR